MTNQNTAENVSPIKARRVRGVVVRRSGDKTVSVAVTRVKRHPKYGKRLVSTKRYLVHDPDNVAKVGQKALIRESRPLSARKRWTLVEVE